AIIRLMFADERERTFAIGIWAATAAGGAAFGPVVGGLLLEYFWWGSVFLVNVPVVLTALVFGAWLIPASPGNPDAPWDLTGSFQIMLGLMGIALAVKEMAKRDASLAVILAALSVGILMLTIFTRRQLRSTAPLIDFSLFRNARFSGGVIGAIVASIALVGVELVYSQRLQLVVGLTPLNAGLALLPIPLAALVSGPLTGLLLGRVGTHRIIVISLALLVLSLVGLLLTADTHGMLKMAVLVLLGASVGATITAASNAVMNNAPPAQAGMAASIEEVSYEMGGALGIAVLGSVLTGTYTRTMVVPAHLATSTDARDSIDAALLAVESMPRAFGDQLLQLAHTAFDQAFGTVIVVAVGIVVAAIVGVMLLDRRRRHESGVAA
ncbi:MAG: MFS transporter, partial [Comamonadaceae bacterium]